MLPKKNPKVDLNKNSTTYFLLGLVLVFFLTWRAIEIKTYERDIELDRLSVLEDEQEDVPITDMKITPPPPPAPQVIEVVEDEEEVEETVIESTETDQEEIIEVEDVAIEDDFDEVDVPFAVIEDVPVFPGCERVAKS
jgi:protein TonB